MRRAILLALIASCASDGAQRQGATALEQGSRRDQLMLAQAVEEVSSRAAMAFTDQVQGRTVNVAIQKGAKPGASLLANLLERDLIRGGAAAVKRGVGGSFQLRIMLKAHGLEQAPLGDGTEITAFVDADLQLVDARGRPIKNANLRVQKVERIDGRGFRTKVEGAVEREPRKETRRRPRTRNDAAVEEETRRDRERREDQAKDRRQAELERGQAAEKARQEEAEGQEEERRAEAQRRADEARAEEEERLAESDRNTANRDPDLSRADKEAAQRAEDDRYEAERKRRRRGESEKAKPSIPRPKLDHAIHCAPEEQIIFSCKVRGAQIVSICASSDLGRRRGWLQYRFGKAKKVVRRFPESLSLARASFTYKQEQSGESMGLQRVYWTQEERRYEVWVKQVDPFAEEEVASAGFKLFKNNRPHRDWKCVSEYVEDLRSLDGVVLDPE